ncbi:cadherin domain-containing protein [Flagellimonas olearia]|nr:cadherin domain-containing protein [Allomuricauda olearia]
MKLKLLLIVSIIAFALHSCSKDDGPKKEANNPPSIQDRTISILESSAPGDNLAQITATDPDGNNLEYSITGEAGPFKISTSGILTLASGQTLDFDVTNSYTITVSVSDGTDSATATITINITEVVPTNQAPEIGDQGFEASEDSEVGVTLYTLENVSDPDGDPITFDISVNDNGLFAINNDGEISLAEGQNLDYETATSHQITVSVSDGTNATEAVVTVTVTNVADTLIENPDSFVTTWITEKNDDIIKIGTDQNLTYDYTIDWGDGTIEIITQSESPTHIYSTEGTYIVAINGTFPKITMFGNVTRHQLIAINQWGTIEWKDFGSSFSGCANMANAATDKPNLSKVTNLSWMFDGASSFNANLGEWDIGYVTNMNNMLNDSGISTENYNDTLIGWAAQDNLPINMVLGANGLTYCGSEAITARNTLLANGWDIQGDAECQN